MEFMGPGLMVIDTLAVVSEYWVGSSKLKYAWLIGGLAEEMGNAFHVSSIEM